MDIPYVQELVMKMTHAQFIVTTITNSKETLKSTVKGESGKAKRTTRFISLRRYRCVFNLFSPGIVKNKNKVLSLTLG